MPTTLTVSGNSDDPRQLRVQRQGESYRVEATEKGFRITLVDSLSTERMVIRPVAGNVVEIEFPGAAPQPE